MSRFLQVSDSPMSIIKFCLKIVRTHLFMSDTIYIYIYIPYVTTITFYNISAYIRPPSSINRAKS